MRSPSKPASSKTPKRYLSHSRSMARPAAASTLWLAASARWGSSSRRPRDPHCPNCCATGRDPKRGSPEAPPEVTRTSPWGARVPRDSDTDLDERHSEMGKEIVIKLHFLFSLSSRHCSKYFTPTSKLVIRILSLKYLMWPCSMRAAIER